MEVQKLLEDVERLNAIVESWSKNSAVSALERELVLEKLRGLYEAVLFLDVPVASAAVSGGNESLPDAPAGHPAADAAGPVLSSGPEETVETPAPVHGVAEVVSVERTVIEETEGPVSLRENSAPQTAVGAEALSEAASFEQKLFSDEPTLRTRVDKQVILSLYGDAPAATPHAPAPSYRRPAESSAEEMRSSAPSSPAVAENGGAKKVLGEVIGTGGAAMNEVLGKQTAHPDVASKLQSQGLKGDLRQHIGVNDRFMLIRVLFDGNADAYAETIAQLDRFTDLDDAMLYIQENYNWNPDSEATQLLVDLLERKLG